MNRIGGGFTYYNFGKKEIHVAVDHAHLPHVILLISAEIMEHEQQTFSVPGYSARVLCTCIPNCLGGCST